MNNNNNNEPNLYQFFDTETTGLPKKWGASITEVDNWPRVIQLAWQLYDKSEELISEGNHLIKPDGWVIPKEKFWIDNGFNTEESNAKGIPIAAAVNLFAKDYSRAVCLVAHNMSYDEPVFGAELIRLGRILPRKPKFCTMKPKEIIKFVGAKDCRGRVKWPKLMELYTKLFGEGFDDAHDAMADVRACAKSFFELKRRGIINV